MSPSGEMCVIDLKIYKCLITFDYAALTSKVLICQVSPNHSAKGRLSGFDLPGLELCFRK